MKVLLVLFSLLFSNVNFNESLNIKTQYEEVEYIEYFYDSYTLKQIMKSLKFFIIIKELMLLITLILLKLYIMILYYLYFINKLIMII